MRRNSKTLLHLSLFICSLAIGNVGFGAESLTITLPKSVASKTKALNSQFLLFPAAKERSEEKGPLLIFLHGGGGGRRPLAKFKNEFVAQQVAERQLPLTVVIPQRITNPKVESGWQPEDLNHLLAYLLEQHPIDPDRVYLTGMSMGGAGTWFWANHSPQHFAAIAPIAAGGQTGPKDPLLVDPKSYQKLPVWAFHGDKDRVCPHVQIDSLVKNIKLLGGPVRFTLYDGVGHGNILKRVYQTDEFYEWLLMQKRSTH